MPDMLHSAADITRWLLVNNGQLGNPNTAGVEWPCYATTEPAKPDNCVTVYDTGARVHGRTMTDGELQEHHAVMLQVRAKDHQTGKAKISALRTYLSKNVVLAGVVINGTAYLIQSYSKIGEVMALGREVGTSARVVFTLNCTVSIRQLT